MKKIFFGMMLALAFSICGCNVENDRDMLLKPYLEIIDKINNMYATEGVFITIPEENKEEIYNNIKKYTLEEFESKLTEDYLAAEEFFSDNR